MGDVISLVKEIIVYEIPGRGQEERWERLVGGHAVPSTRSASEELGSARKGSFSSFPQCGRGR